jgi:hypothetical protein
MKKLKKLLAAIAISGMALLPLANSAHAQVTVYNHGQRVRVAQTASKDWSNVKAAVKGDTYKMTHNGRTGPVIQKQPMSYSANYRVATSRTSMRRHSLAYRARLNRERALRRESLYHARVMRQR